MEWPSVIALQCSFERNNKNTISVVRVGPGSLCHLTYGRYSTYLHHYEYTIYRGRKLLQLGIAYYTESNRIPIL
jgi:hypothetical protein